MFRPINELKAITISPIQVEPVNYQLFGCGLACPRVIRLGDYSRATAAVINLCMNAVVEYMVVQD